MGLDTRVRVIASGSPVELDVVAENGGVLYSDRRCSRSGGQVHMPAMVPSGALASAEYWAFTAFDKDQVMTSTYTALNRDKICK